MDAVKSHAFGVEPNRPPFYLRVSKYHAVGEAVSDYIAQLISADKTKIKLLDVGGDEGRILRHIESHEGCEFLRCDIFDLFPHGTDHVYKPQGRRLIKGDLDQSGLKQIAQNEYDIVICEQVLEHLKYPEKVLEEMHRVLKPGGLLIVGVPIFLHGAHWIRRTLGPPYDKLMKIKPRSHIQSFSKANFVKKLEKCGHWVIKDVRGFRIVSGGILKPLDHYRWWWRFNKWLGAKLPSLCIEVQVLAIKSAA